MDVLWSFLLESTCSCIENSIKKRSLDARERQNTLSCFCVDSFICSSSIDVSRSTVSVGSTNKRLTPHVHLHVIAVAFYSSLTKSYCCVAQFEVKLYIVAHSVPNYTVRIFDILVEHWIFRNIYFYSKEHFGRFGT